MEKIYSKWESLKDERKAMMTTSSPYKLGVRFY